jgi:hypothetical protein
MPDIQRSRFLASATAAGVLVGGQVIFVGHHVHRNLGFKSILQRFLGVGD